MIFQHIVLGIVFLGLGVVSLKYNYQLVGLTGNVSWVEKYLGGGGTYAFFKMVSVALCLGGFLYMTGLWGPLFSWVVSPLGQFFHAPGRTT
jgi:hypothetical protein